MLLGWGVGDSSCFKLKLVSADAILLTILPLHTLMVPSEPGRQVQIPKNAAIATTHFGHLDSILILVLIVLDSAR